MFKWIRKIAREEAEAYRLECIENNRELSEIAEKKQSDSHVMYRSKYDNLPGKYDFRGPVEYTPPFKFEDRKEYIVSELDGANVAFIKGGAKEVRVRCINGKLLGYGNKFDLAKFNGKQFNEECPILGYPLLLVHKELGYWDKGWSTEGYEEKD